MDATSQIVHLSMKQALTLNLEDIKTQTNEVEQKKACTILNYKIIQPADLNLFEKDDPFVANKVDSGLPRGRPKKKLLETSSKTDSIEVQPTKVINTSRTRCGRITKPPIHMEKDYEKIVINTKSSMDATKEVDTVQFEPIKTDYNASEPPPLLTLQPKPKKRNIPAHYKCPTCKKAYLGRNRMAFHLKKNPDHGNSQGMKRDCNSWNFLIETALKAQKGKRGEKFCAELVNLVKNARFMAKNFLKPAKPEKSEYVVDAVLAEILNIKEGNYRFNENGICKDVNIFSFLLDDSFLETNESDMDMADASESVRTFDSLTREENLIPSTPLHKNSIEVDQEKTKSVIDLDFGTLPSYVLDISGLPKEEMYLLDNIPSSINSESEKLKKIPSDSLNIGILPDLQHEFTDKHSFETSSQDSSAADDEKFDSSSKAKRTKLDKSSHDENESEKQIDICRNPILCNVLAAGSTNDTNTEKDKKTARKSDDFDINKFNLVEFLPDAPGTSILDTSTGSDDIMNVDQFVNERFNNLTEPEHDLPFNFNT